MWGSNYPPNSGPPPPPGNPFGQMGMGGFGGFGQQSAYNNTTSYGAPGGMGGMGGMGMGGLGAHPAYPMGAQPPPGFGISLNIGGGMPGFGGGGMPGFGGPPAGPPPGHYGGQPPMPPPQSMQYGQGARAFEQAGLMQAQWQNMRNSNLVEADSEDEEEEARRRRRRRRRRLEEEEEEDEEEREREREEERKRLEEKARKAEEQAQALREKLKDNEDAVRELRVKFINELCRRQDVSGTFEATNGSVTGILKYDEEDLVAVWFKENKDTDIVGERWCEDNDAEYMRKAIRGLGTDEKAIIYVVTTRNNIQRNKIMLAYKTAYGRDLLEDLQGDTSGDFREVLLALFETPARYDAWSIKKAIYGLGTDEQTLIEILFTRTNAQIKEMVQHYNNITYSKRDKPECSIEEDIKDDTSGDFKRLLISACQGNRKLKTREDLDECVEAMEIDGSPSGFFTVNYDKMCNVDKCKRMARELYDAGEERWGTNEETFNRIFSVQDFYTLRVVYDRYVKLSQRDIMNSVDRETSGNYKKGLLAIVQSVKCRPMFFADRLYHSMKGLGTDDSTLIRICVSRSELDMMQIRQCFLEKYKQSLWNFIKHDTSGDYRKILLAMVGKEE